VFAEQAFELSKNQKIRAILNSLKQLFIVQPKMRQLISKEYIQINDSLQKKRSENREKSVLSMKQMK
jgi:hypothetical protein